MSAHDVHRFFNTFVGPSGSSLGNRKQDNNDDDVTNWNDVEICGKFGGGGSDVGISGKFGGVGSGGIGDRRQAVVMDVVEVLSHVN